MPIESRLLHCFVELASDLHFGRTASRLGIVQSALSGHIARLEDIIGGRLLDRGKRAAVRLTPLGTTFLAEARDAVAQLERTERIGRRAAQGAAGPALLSYVFSAALSGVLTTALRAAAQTLPLVELNAVAMETPEQLRRIADARIDAGLLRPQDAYPPGIMAQVVHREPLLVAMADNHALASKPRVDAVDVARERFIVPQVAQSIELRRVVRDLAVAGGVRAPNTLNTGDFITAACMAAAGSGIVLGPESLMHLSIAGVTYREVSDFNGEVELALAWRGKATPLVNAILAAFSTA